jgi:hypothetical protein
MYHVSIPLGDSVSTLAVSSSKHDDKQEAFTCCHLSGPKPKTATIPSVDTSLDADELTCSSPVVVLPHASVVGAGRELE